MQSLRACVIFSGGGRRQVSAQIAGSPRNRGGGGAESNGKELGWWRGEESNLLRRPFQGRALPVSYPATETTSLSLEVSVAGVNSREKSRVASSAATLGCAGYR